MGDRDQVAGDAVEQRPIEGPRARQLQVQPVHPGEVEAELRDGSAAKAQPHQGVEGAGGGRRVVWDRGPEEVFPGRQKRRIERHGALQRCLRLGFVMTVYGSYVKQPVRVLHPAGPVIGIAVDRLAGAGQGDREGVGPPGLEHQPVALREGKPVRVERGQDRVVDGVEVPPAGVSVPPVRQPEGRVRPHRAGIGLSGVVPAVLQGGVLTLQKGLQCRQGPSRDSRQARAGRRPRTPHFAQQRRGQRIGDRREIVGIGRHGCPRNRVAAIRREESDVDPDLRTRAGDGPVHDARSAEQPRELGALLERQGA